MSTVHPENGFIFFNTSQNYRYGAFKSMREGQIELPGLGPRESVSTSASSDSGRCTTSVALKQPYLSNHSSSSDLSSSVIPTLSLSPEGQVKELSADALSIQWASSLLQDVYDFIALYLKSHAVSCPASIPVFRFVTCGLAMTNVPGATPRQKEVYLVEELIQPDHDGPWRKYINNNSSRPCYFKDTENYRRSEFLAFCQHVQYWRTRCLVFTSDFQGGDTLLTDPQIITHPDLGRKLFGKGNVQRTHRDFEKEHKCNVFCKFFKVPTYVQHDKFTGVSGQSEVRLPFHTSCLLAQQG
ncbi:hypothetical protein EDB84DRAFT_1271750 [Lactarius hengduanensis]|nr:hypothetical protein EDB84DRAFT_1274380 [Lactarius hengduanensis]KAH9029458.1 hypothetical protein EDB84DRAFT_1271750 [Lactarius hengduanensis]